MRHQLRQDRLKKFSTAAAYHDLDMAKAVRQQSELAALVRAKIDDLLPATTVPVVVQDGLIEWDNECKGLARSGWRVAFLGPAPEAATLPEIHNRLEPYRKLLDLGHFTSGLKRA